MTIAAGFRVLDGVLLCADTEHSSGGIVTHEPKIIPVDFVHGKALFAFSGDNVELSKAAIQKCIVRLRAEPKSKITSHRAIALLVEETVNREYRKHVCKEPDAIGSSVYQILLAAWSPHDGPDGPGLYCTWQGTIHECESYECLGTGFYIGRYLIESMFSPGMNVHSARIVATYAIAQAKSRVDGCGGKTYATALRTDGSIEGFDWSGTKELEETFQTFDAKRWFLLFNLLTQDDSKFQDSLFSFSDAMINLRVELGIDADSRQAIREYMYGIAKLSTPSFQADHQSTTADSSRPQPPPE